ncbi:mechanosensitive ion channel family protein [Candidatus Velamenicoccus archaeovorus]|uniref:mechanosensitive ion channel family protein n=1 Tax=Velamenicoccus archaeovorus TaxID=1930593 RepID=UPI000FFECAA0|nr:mechanosensitive ion channel family protein [Candidatus Velamenicoccus archaeovorus]
MTTHPLFLWFQTAALPVSVFLVTIFAGAIVKKVIFARLNQWALATKHQIDDIIIESIRQPIMIWFVMLGLYLALGVTSLPENWVQATGKILVVLGIFSATLAIATIVGKLINLYASKIEGVMPVTSLTQNIGRIIIFGIGVMIIMNSLGISITPILATLGVGGLAVALALQDTLSNLFAGFHTTIARQVRVGDYVKLETGEEGYVTDINWRTTKIRMLPNNVVLVPNAKLTQAVIINYYLPDREMSVLVEVGVHYDSDLDKVERVTCEAAKEVMKEVPGGVPGFEPFIRFHTFADSSINFSVILRAKEFTDQYLVKHEFIKRLHKRYAKENINIPYPIRAINYRQEDAQKQK